MMKRNNYDNIELLLLAKYFDDFLVQKHYQDACMEIEKQAER